MSVSSDPSKLSLTQALFSRKMLISLFNGFSAGLPLYYIYQLIPAWLRDQGVDLKTIGLFALVGLAYNWKFLWAPLMDNIELPFLGLRRGWILLMQICCMGTMFSMSLVDPGESIEWIVLGAAVLAFFSANQDTALDAYRRELLEDRELGLGNSFYMNGYRVAGFIPGGLGLILADVFPWSTVHILVGSFMLLGVIKTLLISEIEVGEKQSLSLGRSVVEPLKEFFGREGKTAAFLFLAFLFSYKLGDNLATALSTPFYLDVGFSKTQIGLTNKSVSFIAMLLGSFIGGIGIFKYGINRCLWVFGVVQMASILGFAVLNEQGPVVWLLGVVIGFEYLGVGLGASALMAFMARATNKNFTATQFALFSSLIALPRTFANATTGFLIEGIAETDGWLFEAFGIVEGMGYTRFFIFCTLTAIPGMVLLYWVAPWNGDQESSSS
jgi:PAT family beta-lactamase induction signal transducer AmpG